MSPGIRWVALLPDPVTGMDTPVSRRGETLQWLAPDRKAATALVKAELQPREFRLASVVSLVDWQARQQLPQRQKTVTEPTGKAGFIVRNASRRCQTCGQAVSPFAFYCPEHRSQKARKQYTDARRTG